MRVWKIGCLFFYMKSPYKTFLIAASLLSHVAYTFADDFTREREQFRRAEKYLQNGQYRQFKQIKATLKKYPLYPYLSYWDLLYRLPRVSDQEINFFLQRYSGPVTVQLRQAWLMHQAQHNHWRNFLRYYQPNDSDTLTCLHLSALMHTQQKQAHLKVKNFWIKYDRPPQIACVNTFSLWKSKGFLTDDLFWNKFEWAIDRQNQPWLDYLSVLLEKPKHWIALWNQVRRDPSIALTLDRSDLIKHRIWFYGLKRLASQDPSYFVKNRLMEKYRLSPTQKKIITRILALNFAMRLDDRAPIWLKQIDPRYVDASIRQWRVRYALAKQDWPETLLQIKRLTKKERQTLQWLYWRAFALEQLKQKKASIVTYKQLSKEVDYYGLQASRRLNQRYQPAQKIVHRTPESLKNHEAFIQGSELYHLGHEADARAQWLWGIAHQSTTPQQLQAASILAGDRGWYDLCILAAKKIKPCPISLMFPKPHLKHVLASSLASDLSRDWLWAIMRQESLFMPKAQSRVGALGLMQLLPSTAKFIGDRSNFMQRDLFKPEVNIRLGSLYLRYLFKMFDRDTTLMVAAYNAGPTRVKRRSVYLAQLPKAIWIETIPWEETRNYVKSVHFSRAIYGRDDAR